VLKRIFGGKISRQEPVGRPTCRWEYNFEMDSREIGYGVLNGFIWFRIGTIGGLL
jgi:hypothetical protein